MVDKTVQYNLYFFIWKRQRRMNECICVSKFEWIFVVFFFFHLKFYLSLLSMVCIIHFKKERRRNWCGDERQGFETLFLLHKLWRIFHLKRKTFEILLLIYFRMKFPKRQVSITNISTNTHTNTYKRKRKIL
jgi:hypothetical protein